MCGLVAILTQICMDHLALNPNWKKEKEIDSHLTKGALCVRTNTSEIR
jgi:hypothetical protein